MWAALVIACFGSAPLPASSFKSAFVEHRVILPCGTGSCGAKTKAANVKAYASFVEEAAAQGAHIITFPEYGITGASSYPASAWVSGGYSESFATPSPAAAARVVPCSSSGGFGEAPSVVALSCAAQKYRVAVVANLAEYDHSARQLFNTDVAFDTDGAFVAAYRKQNLWGETPPMSTPTVCAEVAFTTSFGVRFGLATCADLIYPQPMLRLLSAGVQHFLLPTSWSNTDGQMQVLGYAQGWSANAGRGVSLTVANNRGEGESGSGVFVGGEALAAVYNTTGGSELRVVTVAVNLSAAKTSGVGGGGGRGGAAAGSPARDAGARAEAGGVRAGGVARVFRSDDDETGSSWVFAAPSAAGTTRLCSPRASAPLCCELTGVGAAAAASVVLALVDGVDGDGGDVWGAHACALLPCDTPEEPSRCLRYRRAPSAEALPARANLTLCGLAATDVAVAEVVATSAGREQFLLKPSTAGSSELAPGEFAFDNGQAKGACASLRAAAPPASAIGSAVIYGRRFVDDQLAYSCSR
eukprot:g3924.t1